MQEASPENILRCKTNQNAEGKIYVTYGMQRTEMNRYRKEMSVHASNIRRKYVKERCARYLGWKGCFEYCGLMDKRLRHS